MPKTIKNKIGIGLITCDRLDLFKISYKSLEKGKDYVFVVVDDGIDTSVKDFVSNEVHYVKTEGKEGVAVAKNKAFRYLIESNCEHIFLIEDDIEILDTKVFDLYINASKKTGIKHFNFGLHGNHNRDQYGNPTISKIINYPDDTKVVLYPNVLGALSYYHIETLDAVGLIDEQFYNALEHVDHTLQIIKKGYHPPFRWFADVEGVDKLVKDIVPDHKQSKIRSDVDFMENFFKNHEKFVKKNDFAIVYGYGPQEKVSNEKEVTENLKEIWRRHAGK
jgi:GT2 family glycosyltransferase